MIDYQFNCLFSSFLMKGSFKCLLSRQKLITMTFNSLDKDEDGEVNPEELVEVYDASRHDPEVINGRRSEEVCFANSSTPLMWEE